MLDLDAWRKAGWKGISEEEIELYVIQWISKPAAIEWFQAGWNDPNEAKKALYICKIKNER